MRAQKTRAGQIDDASQLARIHKNAISVDILSVMNNQDVLTDFYKEVLAEDNFFVVVCEDDDGTVVSFSVFAKTPSFIPIFLRSFYRNNSLSIIRSCLKSMKMLKMVINRLKKVKHQISVDISGFPELLIMATDTQNQNRGFGTRVVLEGLKKIPGNKCIVKTHSLEAKQFYNRAGFKDIGTEQTGNWLLWVLLYSE